MNSANNGEHPQTRQPVLDRNLRAQDFGFERPGGLLVGDVFKLASIN
jgi:hypothetical protein